MSLAYFVSNDNVFNSEDVTQRFKKNGLCVSVCKSILDAKNKLSTHIDDARESIIGLKKEKIKTFLEAKTDDIFKYILDNAQISEGYLMGRGMVSALSGNEPIEGTLEEVLNINPKRISSVFYGLLSKKSVAVGKVEPITFSVAVEFTVLIRQMLPLRGKLIKLSTLEQELEFEDTYYDRDEHTIERDISVEALLSRKNGDYDKLDFLKVLMY